MKEAISILAKKIEGTKNIPQTEEATKNAFVLPFLSALGYDVFNTTEVVPEYTADIGTKQGEKVDYAIILDGVPALLIECKPCQYKLSAENESQLMRYYHGLKARFAILTNGIVYKFYTDLERTNVMDKTPFLEINLSNSQNINYNELEKFSKGKFDVANISVTASKLKTINTVRSILDKELVQPLKEKSAMPSEEFVRFIFEKIKKQNNGKRANFNSTAKEKLESIIKIELENIINNRVQESVDEMQNQLKRKREEYAPKIEENDGVETTEEEKDAFNIVKAIASEIVNPTRIEMRDAKSYCAILFDNNNRRPICRLYFNDLSKKSIVLFDTGLEERIKINKLSEIFYLRSRLLATIKKYI